ncbi:hypothetical protein ACF1G0_00480 [Streptomyces sp. NPDC013953]|uniref:hypothetical protein n=1 Tax=Streptomyces sp. NPDC013953 TaxID=3364868 RepID=UPI0036FE57A3
MAAVLVRTDEGGPSLGTILASRYETRPRTAYTLLAASTLLSSAYGVYLMLVWQRSP